MTDPPGRLSRRLPRTPPYEWTPYEIRKHEWIAAHPDATPEEYLEAMRELAKECGT